MMISNLMEFSLPQESSHPIAGMINQILQSKDSVLLFRETDAHEVALETGEILCSFNYERLIEYPQRQFVINDHAANWRSPDGSLIVRLRQAPNSAARLTCNETKSGRQRWEVDIVIEPSLAEHHPDFAPDDPELFFAMGTAEPVLCIQYAPEDERGLLLHQLSVTDGAVRWTHDIKGAFVDIMTKPCFDGFFRTRTTVGRVDFDACVVHQTDHLPSVPSQPIRIGERIYFSGYTKSTATLWSAENHCANIEQIIQVEKKKVSETAVYAAADQPVLRVNQDTLWFKDTSGHDASVTFKPWVYGVVASPGGPLFVLTDGNGGRLLAFDRTTHENVLDLKPTIGGYGHYVFLENHAIILATIATKRDRSQTALQVISTLDCKHALVPINFILVSAFHNHALLYTATADNQNAFAFLDLRELKSQL